ncbi:TadE/TadG family type IV pilus assembly protein [Albidovulum sp.]|uniref:TadE/TadG family type IV pilus assembly protein n=1 Tax=Albidovulum sp. TaxID=1872424 RepID=UPI001DB11205|nr:pilus assembly protein [Paracoccaceae bacterium]MCC0047134.1 pilus assembly protein [Defluviimonas sp.]HPE24874.1 TadE/TadG family type IV pilus assembly protein [Albidovulum sp.]MCB2118395.1 pilus assembly protein [Paracoccaceae bacterium]MCB2121365.1 pilus assembly protein [Paracoccaceae bacterium]
MTRLADILGGLARGTRGAALVELAIVLPLFLLIFLGIIDFGRLGYDVVTAEKAMQKAARIAIVRPPVCNGVPNTTSRDTSNTDPIPPRFGTACNAGGPICAAVVQASCTLAQGMAAGSTTAQEIWNSIDDLVPANATAANVRITYDDSAILGNASLRLGFLGGPYVPIVTAQIEGLTFNFVTPIAGFVSIMGGTSTFAQAIQFPALNVSLPAEDLAQGEDG